MKNTILLLNGLWLLGLVACQPKSSSLSECPIVNVRSALQEETPISMKEDVVSIQYIPLETTDSCLISNLLNLQVTTDYMFMYNGKTEEVLQFDRKGKFIRRVGRQGNGPGEYSMISELAVDDSNKELSIFQYGGDALVYSYDGSFLRNDTTVKQAGGMYVFADGKRALKGLVMKPFEQAPWAGALQQADGLLLKSKSLFPQGLSQDVCFMKEICFSPSTEGVLLFTACNDTVAGIYANGIEPAYVLKRENPTEYYVDIANINKFRDNTVETDQIIGVYDLFESPHYLYLRLYKGDAIFIQRFDKKTGELKSQRIPDDYLECSAAIPGGNVIGMDNDIDGGIPFWPEYVMADGGRAQVVNADILLALREKGYLKQATDVLNIGDEANPVVILYKFKR